MIHGREVTVGGLPAFLMSGVKMGDEHEHEYNWTEWYEAGTGVTHMLEAKDYKCACGAIKGRDTRNGRKLTDDEKD